MDENIRVTFQTSIYHYFQNKLLKNRDIWECERGKLLTRIWRKATSKLEHNPNGGDSTIGDPQCNGWFDNRDTIERRDRTDWLRAVEGRCSIIRYLYRSLILFAPLRHRVIFFGVDLVWRWYRDEGWRRENGKCEYVATLLEW